MDPSDFIGFIISLLALAYLFFRRRGEARRRREHPELYKEDEQQEDALKEFLRSMDMPVEDHPKPVRHPEPVQPKIKKAKVQTQQQHWRTNIEDRKMQTQIEQRRLQSAIDDRRLKTTIEERNLQSTLENRYADPYGQREMVMGKEAPAYETIQSSRKTRVQYLLERLPSKKEMVILQEIINPPKAMR